MTASDRPPLIVETSAGLFCPRGGFHIDPKSPADLAIVTHAHSDHVVRGCRRYVASRTGANLLRWRLGQRADVLAMPFQQTFQFRDVTVSLHPAGHLLGSAQVRVEHEGDVWVVSGDYKLAADRSCEPFEPVRCRVFITESSFAKPAFAWPDPAAVFDELHAWWKENQSAGRASRVLAYSLGKAQRILAHVDRSIGPIYVADEMISANDVYRSLGIPLAVALPLSRLTSRTAWGKSLILAPPQRRNGSRAALGDESVAFASGWMQSAKGVRPGAVDRGFVLSDHADFQETLRAIESTGAEQIYVVHGFVQELIAELRARGLAAGTVPRWNAAR